MLFLVAPTSSITAASSTLPIVPAHHPPTRQRRCGRPLLLRLEEEEESDGAAIFRPFSAEEAEIDVPDSSKRFIVGIFAVPIFLVLAGVATYNPSDDEIRQEQQRRANALRLRGGSQTSWQPRQPRLVRRAVLGSLALAIQTIPCRPAAAAVPSISEYSAVQYKKKPAAVPEAPALEPLDTKAGWAKLTETLEQTEALLASKAFEDVRLLLRTPIFRDFLGYNPGVRSTPGNSMRPAAALMSAFPEESRVPAATELAEMLVDLKVLDDFCFANRVIFFNQEDREAIGQLMEANRRAEAPVQVDVEEATAMLNDARQRLRLAIALYYGKDCVACNGEAKSAVQ